MTQSSIFTAILALTTIVASPFVASTLPAQAATLTNVTIGFDEYVFPSTSTIQTGTQAYNLFNDTTGTELTANNGDGNDFAISLSNSGAGALSTPGTPNLKVGGGKIVSDRAFQGNVKANNPGTLVSTTTKLIFDAQWNITNLEAKFTSLNTSGTLWEYSVLSFLKPDGTTFSAAPSIASYTTASNFTGSPSLGWYVAANTNTIEGVGTTKTSPVGNGPNDNLVLTYTLAGLAANTPIGGLVWTTYLEDTRGTANGISNFTASWQSFTVSGTHQEAKVEIDEPSAIPTPALLPGLLLLAVRSRRRAAN
jgi:hypothetical protein